MGSRRRHMALASLISRQAIDVPRRPQRHWDPMLAGQRPTYAFRNTDASRRVIGGPPATEIPLQDIDFYRHINVERRS